MLLFLFASVLGLFPRTLPRAAARRVHAQQESQKGEDDEEHAAASIKGKGS